MKILSTIVAQRVQRVGVSPNAHWPLNQDIVSLCYAHYVRPVCEVLCDQSLPEKRLLDATQNRNESFNSLIWARAPKTEYATMSTIEVAVSQAVLVFNSGNKLSFPSWSSLGMLLVLFALNI